MAYLMTNPTERHMSILSPRYTVAPKTKRQKQKPLLPRPHVYIPKQIYRRQG